MPARYGLAVAAAVAGTLGMFALYAGSGIERGSVPFIFYFVAVIVVALYGGRGPVLLAIALSDVASNFFFLGPANAFALDQEAHDFLVDALGRPLADAPGATDRALAQAERAILETLEHHAHLRLRPVGRR